MSSISESLSQFMMLGVSHSASLYGYNTNGILQTAEGNLLIDCGHTIKAALNDQSLAFEDVTAIYITHVHGDHVFGLERFAFETRFNMAHRIKLYLEPKLLTELWDQTLKGSLGLVNGEPQTIEDYFDIELINDGRFCFGGHQFKTFQVDHAKNKPAYGFVIDDYLFYSGDTRPIPSTIEALDFEVGFHDSTLVETSPVHANMSSILASYSDETCSKLLLMGYEVHDDFLQLPGASKFKGLAKVGQLIPLTVLVTP